MFLKVTWATFIALVCFCQVAPAKVFAAEPATPAGKTVMSTVDDVRTTVHEQKDKISPEALDERLKRIIYPVFNFNEMSMRSLGPNWNRAKPEERSEFVTLFSDLLAKNYLRKIRENVTKSKVEFVGESQSENSVLVRTTVSSDDDKAAIDYRLHELDGKWRVYDVIIENIGLVSNYRSEFAGIIRKDGFDGLLRKLREKKVGEKETK
jgi:phospholipid transport system substrate-binding protein